MSIENIRYGFYNSINHDRIYTAEDISGIFDGIVGDGIAQYGDRFQVLPYISGGTWVIQIGIGRAWFNQTWIHNPEPLYLTVTPPPTGYNRKDYVILRIDKPNRSNTITMVAGNNAVDEPSALYPTLSTGTDGIYEYALYGLVFGPNASSISDVTFVDFRGVPSSQSNSYAKYLSWIALFGESGSVLDITSGGTGSNSVEGARINLGLGNSSGNLPILISQGGTGATTARNARANLGIGDYNDGTGLPIVNGGTGANTVNGARMNLGLGTSNGSLPIQISQGGTGATTAAGALANIINGASGTVDITAAQAQKLKWGTKILVNLASTTTKTITGVNGNESGAQDLTNSGDGGIGVYGTLPVARGGTGNTTGNAATATKLATARSIQVKLGSTSAVNFDGSANITPGVSGTLALSNGGTGQTTWYGAHKALGVQVDSLNTSSLSTLNASLTFNCSKYDQVALCCRPQGTASDSGFQVYTVPVAWIGSGKYITFANDDVGAFMKFYLTTTSIKLVAKGSLSGAFQGVYGVNKNAS